jgi:hypothetical protein
MTQVTQRQETVEQAIARLETFVHRMERRYECTSDEATEAVRDGTMRETAEIGKWLTNYRTLQRLRGIIGATAR